MKKILLFITFFAIALCFYVSRIKKSFKYEIISIDNIYNHDDNYYLDLILKVSNSWLPKIEIEEIFLDVWINGEYFGNTYNNQLFNIINGSVKIPLTIKSKNPGLSIALMIEKEKNVQAKGFIKTSLIKIPIDFEDKF